MIQEVVGAFWRELDEAIEDVDSEKKILVQSI